MSTVVNGKGVIMNMRNKKIKIILILVLCFGILLLNVYSIPSVKIEAKKATYYKQFAKLEKLCKQRFKYDGSQYEMNLESKEEYDLWDKELNRVYKKALVKINKKKQNALKISELKWIKKRDKKAKNDSKVWTGGSGYILCYNLSLVSSTKKRIKWIISKYL